MSADAVHGFIAVVALHFPRPKFSEDEMMEGAWMASMTRVLSPYPDDVLAAAAQHIIDERNPKKDGRFFPVPSECREACDAAVDRLRAAETPLLAAPPEVPYWARVDLARDLMQSPMGQLAKRENWDTRMYHFCVENMRVPGGKEIDECKRDARKFAAIYEECLRGEHPFGRPLARLAESMVRKAREMMGTSA